MTDLLNLFKRDNKAEKMAIAQAIRRLETFKTPIRMELENSYINFRTVVSSREGMLVVAKPNGLNEQITKGTFLRFRLTDLKNREVRLEVVHSHVNLNNGGAVFLCKYPIQFTAQGRYSTRFDTSHLMGVTLEAGPGHDEYRIMDISQSGVKVQVPMGDLKSVFPLGKQLSEAQINIKGNIIPLVKAVPRVYKGRSVGMELELDNNGSGMFDKVIRRMEMTADSKMYQTSSESSG
ncbi:MAG: hypothetical protein OEW12_03225 [Deltaproteobacteria bacterium]|nr:hypothetical protein [Deltaproteobacteria bacterium]